MSSNEYYKRSQTKKINIRELEFGGSDKVYIESMTKTDTRDAVKTLDQIYSLYSSGCEIVRVAVEDTEALNSMPEIVSSSPIPVIPDIHFDYKMAMESMDYDIGGIRINPGNIGSFWKVEEIINKARDRDIHIRIGVNAGSLSREMIENCGGRNAEAMVRSTTEILDKIISLDFNNLVVSLKSHDVGETVSANMTFAREYDLPLHLGITEAGYGIDGISKSSVGLGILLGEGIGNSIRVSLTGPPQLEIVVGRGILRSLGLFERGVELISCPTCGRCRVNLLNYVVKVKRMVNEIDKNIKVAVMGCEVNGPGEASDADIGIAFGRVQCLIFKDGEVVEKVDNDEGIVTLMRYIEDYV